MQLRLLTLAVIVFMGIVVFDSRASANDSSFGGAGSDLVPVKQNEVRMASEDIVATFEYGHWRVTAKYVFENPTARAIEIQMGFPEARCDEDSDCHVPAPFQGLRTLVRGEPVEHRKGHVSLKKRFGVLGTIWQYDVRFEPRERVAIDHTYRVEGTYALGGVQELLYITETGAMWAGPIGKARFRFRLTPWMEELSYTDDPAPKAVSLVRVGSAAFLEVRFEERNWTPKGNLFVAFVPYSRTEMSGDWVPPHVEGLELEKCPLDLGAGAWEVEEAHKAGRQRVDELLSEWSALSRGALRTCRNAIFAIYGRRFVDDRYNRYFYGPNGWTPGNPPFGRLQPNPAFSPSLLDQADWLVLRYLREAEAKRLPND